MSGDDIESVLESISAPVQLESALLRLMAGPSIVERHLGEGHLSALLSEAHINTWLVVEGQLDVARAVRGSRPGCCLADFAFNVAFAPALVDVRCALGDAGFLWEPPAARDIFTIRDVDRAYPVDSIAPSAFTYADGSCLCCVFRSNIGVASAVLGACVLLRMCCCVVAWLSIGTAACLPPLLRSVVPCPGQPSAICSVSMVIGSLFLALPAWCISSGFTCISALMCVRVAPCMGPAVAARIRAHAQAMSPLRRCVCPRQAVSTKAKFTPSLSLPTY